MRRVISYAVIGVAALLLPVVAAPAAPAQANPADCPTGTILAPLNLPSGTAVTVLNDFSGTHMSDPPSTIRFGPADNPHANTLGSTAGTCVLNGLSYNSDDGYLYAFAEAEVATAPTPGMSTLMRIGYDAGNTMAIEQVGVLDASLLTGVETVTPFVAGYSAAQDAVLLPGLGSQDPSSPAALQPWVIAMPTNGGTPSSVAQTFDGSCAPFLRNFVGASIAYGLMVATLAAQGAAAGIVEPEGGLQDWAVNPADGMIYGYASVDARQSAYPSPFDAVSGPFPPLGVTPNPTQSYLGLAVTIPALAWLPAGVAGPHVIERQSDWVLRIDPASGSTSCAAAGAPAQSGAINLGNGFSATDPVYGSTGALVPLTGGSEISGSGFTSATQMQLFDSEQSRHFSVDVTSCTFTSTTPSCVVTQQAPLGLARSRGDGAGHYQPPLEAEPIAPVLTASPACGLEASVQIPQVRGISYTSTRTGDAVQIQAQAQAGYVLPADATAQWSFTIPAIEPCPTGPTAEPATPTAGPAMPLTGAGGDLADTGVSSVTPVLSVLGAALVLAGAAMMVLRRRLVR
ncbi:MAG: LAETG motif-containing sortase-dependent surface protein [Beutenbergiaceae bacterium]